VRRTLIDAVQEASLQVGVIKPIAAVILIVTAIGLICEIFLPASGRAIDMGAGILAAATWIVPPLLMARPRNWKPRSSLAGVGIFISIFVIAACLSAMGLSLALLTLFFGQEANWAWPAIWAIGAFWLFVCMLFYVTGCVLRKAQLTTGRVANGE
jgi:hypothetical protein